MRIITWNVNGLRACLRKGFAKWLERAAPDILCLQETRVLPEELAAAERGPADYTAVWNSGRRKGYSGTLCLFRHEPRVVTLGLGRDEFDDEGRLIIADVGDAVLFNAYFPNGGRDLSRVGFKLRFYDLLLLRIQELHRQKRTVIVTGDFNTCHRPIDLARPKENEKNTGFLPEERERLDRYIGAGLADSFREEFPDRDGAYTWWSQRAGARKRNVGWRLDYFLVSRLALPRVKRNTIHSDVQGSDHCPVEIEWE